MNHFYVRKNKVYFTKNIEYNSTNLYIYLYVLILCCVKYEFTKLKLKIVNSVQIVYSNKNYLKRFINNF